MRPVRGPAVAACLLLALSAGGAGADTTGADFELHDTQDLLQLCSAGGESLMAAEAINFCYGVIAGAYQMHEAIAANDPRKRLVCPPSGVTRADGRRVFVEWATANRQHWQEPAVDGLFRAWTALYPCKTR